MELSGLCAVFNIEGEINKELFNYIDKKQKEQLQHIKNEYKDDEEYELYARLYMGQFCSLLLQSKVEGLIKCPDWSYQNDFKVITEDHKLIIFWKLHNPTVQRLKYEYDL